MNQGQTKFIVVQVISLVLTWSTFALDMVTPLGLPVWLFYLVPILLLWWAPSRIFPFAVAGLCSILMGLGFWLAPPGVSFSYGLTNRLIGIVLFWSAAFGVSTISETEPEPERPLFGLSRRTFVNLTSLGLIVILLGVVTYRVTAANQESNKLVTHTHAVLTELSLTLSALTDSETGQRGFLLTGEDRYLEPYRRALSEVHDHLDRLTDLTRDNPVQQDRLPAFTSRVEEKLAELQEMLVVNQNQGLAAALRIITTDRGKGLMDDLRRQVAEMEDTERELLGQRQQQARILSDSQTIMLVLGGCLLAGLTALTVALLRREQMIQREFATVLRQTLATLDATRDGLFIFDPGTLRFSHVNEGAVQQVGYSREELLHMTPLDIKPEFDEPRFRAMLAPLLNGTRPIQSFTTVHRRKDGVDIPVEINLQCVAPGTAQTRLIAVVRDITERKRAEEALRKSAEEIRDLYDGAPCGYHSLDRDGVITEINQTELKWLGFTRDEVVGKRKISDLLTPESAARFQANFPLFKERGWVNNLEFDLITKDGSLLPVALNATAIKNEAGRYVKSRSTLFDITDRKKAEAEHDRFFTLSLDLLCIADKRGYFKRVSPAFTRTLGWSMEEFLRRPFIEFVHPDDRAATLREFEKLVVAGKPVLEFENRYQHKDGSWRTLSWKSVPLPDGCIYAAARDVTSLRQAQQAQQRLAAIVESTDDAIIAQTLDGIVITWNQGAERLYGYGAEEVIGRPLALLLPPDRMDEEEMIVSRIRQGTRIQPFETVRRSKDGSLIDVSLTISPIQDEHEAIIGISKIARDITERKQAQAELQRQSCLLEVANKELESFSYSVSHDLRAPLRSLDGFSLALQEDCAGRLDDKGKDYLNRIRAASQRMGQLIDDLLQLSRTTKAELRREPVDLSALALGLAEEVRKQWPGHRVELIVAPGLTAIGDRRLLSIVFDNLLGNAWKFTSKREQAVIEVGGAQRDGETVYFVRDNGVGFDMAYAGKLFGVFQRLHAMTEFPGTGIGLATVQRIVHRHGGRVWAEGAVGQGATVFFTLEG